VSDRAVPRRSPAARRPAVYFEGVPSATGHARSRAEQGRTRLERTPCDRIGRAATRRARGGAERDPRSDSVSKGAAGAVRPCPRAPGLVGWCPIGWAARGTGAAQQCSAKPPRPPRARVVC